MPEEKQLYNVGDKVWFIKTFRQLYWKSGDIQNYHYQHTLDRPQQRKITQVVMNMEVFCMQAELAELVERQIEDGIRSNWPWKYYLFKNKEKKIISSAKVDCMEDLADVCCTVEDEFGEFTYSEVSEEEYKAYLKEVK